MRLIYSILLLFIALFCGFVIADISSNGEKLTVPGNAKYFEVKSVDMNDTLNLREYSNGKSNTVFRLPYNAKGMLMLSQSKGWVKLSYKGYVGWAYRKYLKEIISPSVSAVIKNELFCIGTEPHWTLKSNNHEMIYKKYDDKAQYMLNSSLEKKAGDKKTWYFSAVKSQGKSDAITVELKQNKQCTDEMSDTKYTYSISIKDKEMGVLNGCCK